MHPAASKIIIQEDKTLNKIQRAAIYIRVSTSEQAMHGKSLQAQKECLEKYALDHDMTVIGVYADEGQTARKELKKRKAIHKLLEDVKRHEVDIILFWKMDRWFRNVSDFYKVQDILDHFNVKWIAVAEPNMNMETRDGRLNLNIMLSIGQNEVDTTSERIKFTVNNMIENGRLVWGEKNIPMGYKIETINGEKKMVKNEEEAVIVEEVYRFFLRHQSKRKTVLHIQETFGIEFSYSMLRTMLSSEFYIGKYRNCVNYCPAYLTYDQWEQIQTFSKRNIKLERSNRIYYFTSLIHCPICGQKLVGTGCNAIISRKTGEKRTYCYYRCNKSFMDNLCSYRHRLSQNLIEEYLLNNLEKEFEKYLMRCNKIKEKKKIKKGRSLDSIHAEMERLNMLFQKGRVTFEYYEEQYERLSSESASVQESEPVKIHNYDYLKNLFNNDFASIYNKLTPENKRSFWRSIISEIRINAENTITEVDFF